MEYIGENDADDGHKDGKLNGHKGWVCLHEDSDELDEQAVKDFSLEELLGYR